MKYNIGLNKKLILLLIIAKSNIIISQPSEIARYRHDYSGSSSPGEMYGPQKLKTDYKPLPWKDKFPRYEINVTDILKLHRMTQKEPTFDPILTKKKENGFSPRVPELLRPIQVRCPKGWSPWGPMCIAEVSLGPRTECFGDHSRFVSAPSGTTPKQTSMFPGICQEKRVIGPSLSCPLGMKLRLRYESETNAETGEVTPNVISWACEGYKIIPYSSLNGGLCPAGYSRSIEGCKAFQVIPPNAVCPKNSEPSYTGSNFALYEKSEMVCTITRYTKGRIWCPKGFNVISPPEVLDKYEFGEEISEDFAYKVITGTYTREEKEDQYRDILESEMDLIMYTNEISGDKNIVNKTSKSFHSFISNLRESQANIQIAEMQGMSAGTTNNFTGVDVNLSNSSVSQYYSNNGTLNNIPELKELSEKINLLFQNNLIEMEEQYEKKKWDNVFFGNESNSNNWINMRKLQSMASGGSIEEQLFEPGLVREVEYGPLSGLTMGTYGDVYGKETEEEILLTGNLGQIMGNNEPTSFPFPQQLRERQVDTREPVCSLIVAVHSSECSPLQCKNPFLKELNHILRDWVVFVLEADPDTGSNLIPSGKDLPFTAPG
ncbi:hypothetical protein FG379_003285 [Cryptosporidium bovis]|uniref:uncharacterized protein n=1 Tax=Cryptosporidium bovis TaxID=310047 RepID=UPI00351A0B11|nr:hypothetical protein FG379_003285 [Cryptosporidium bovis]